jgi:hypothetical protein
MAETRPAPTGAPLPLVVTETPLQPPEIAPAERPRGPLHWVILSRERVTPAVSRMARHLLGRPMGSETVREIEDEPYAFIVEPHYHSPESGLTPVGWHKGVTVYGLEERSP